VSRLHVEDFYSTARNRAVATVTGSGDVHGPQAANGKKEEACEHELAVGAAACGPVPPSAVAVLSASLALAPAL